MITTLQIKGYKLLRDNNISLRPLTLLAGLNCTGKSSLFEAIQLLHQSHLMGNLSTHLALNGPIINTQTCVFDVAPDSQAAIAEVEISLVQGGETYRHKFATDDYHSRQLATISHSTKWVPPAISHHAFDQQKFNPLILENKLPDHLFLIENPETRLHASLATEAGIAMAVAANKGAQVIIETHSDHVFLGVRLAVHQGLTDPEDVLFLHFERLPEGGLSIDPLTIDRHGRLPRWPNNFFDEWDNSLSDLLEPLPELVA